MKAVTRMHLVPIASAGVVLVLDAWVYADARGKAEAGRPVTFRAGSLVIDTPALWFLCCLIMWVVVFPLYLTTRA